MTSFTPPTSGGLITAKYFVALSKSHSNVPLKYAFVRFGRRRLVFDGYRPASHLDLFERPARESFSNLLMGFRFGEE